MSKEQEFKAYQIMGQCPKFDRCSAPICPLDPLQDQRDAIKGEPKCTLSKRIRVRIGTAAGLERKGMTKLEWASAKRWEQLDDVERQRRTAHLKGNKPILTGLLEPTTEMNDSGRVGEKVP